MILQNDRCSAASATPKNTGKKAQCHNKPFYTFLKWRNGFKFDSVADATNEAKIREAVKNKDIIPTYHIDGIADNETANVVFDLRNSTEEMKAAIAGSTYSFRLSTCSHAALKSLENAGYKNGTRITQDNYMRCVVNEDGTVSPEIFSSFFVGTQKEATLTEPALTEVSIKYGDYVPSDKLVNFDIANMEGILDLDFVIVSATATEIKFKAVDSCAGSNVTDLVLAELAVKDTDGADYAFSLVAPDASGIYTATGTAFATGFTIGTKGVIEKEGDLYEGLATINV